MLEKVLDEVAAFMVELMSEVVLGGLLPGELLPGGVTRGISVTCGTSDNCGGCGINGNCGYLEQRKANFIIMYIQLKPQSRSGLTLRRHGEPTSRVKKH